MSLQTRHFRIEQANGRYFLSSPLAKRFLSLGINHVGALAEEDPFNLFSNRYQGDWNKMAESALKNFKAWEFNTAGYHSPFALHPHLPFMAEAYPYPAPIAYWMSETNYPDVFDPCWDLEIKKIVDLMHGLAQPYAENLIGYYWTDTPRWDIVSARAQIQTDWVSAIRSLPPSAPGKQRYTRFLEDRHRQAPTILKSVYHMDPETSEPSTETILNVDPGHPVVISDDWAFLRLIARKYYQTLGNATRSADPETLIFGDRYLGGDLPEVVIQESLPWIDVLSVQPLGVEFEEELFDALYELTRKPILICDHQSSFYTPAYPNTLWPQVSNEKMAAEAYHAYLTAAFKKPYIIGYHRCQYIDRFDKQTQQLKQGLLRQDETPYRLLTDQVRQTNLWVLNQIPKN